MNSLENNVKDGIPSRSSLLSTCERGLELARSRGADHAELVVDWEREQEASLQKNDLDQLRSSEETTIGVRVIVGGRPGFATTNRADALDEAIDEAIAVARTAPVDPLAHLAAGVPSVDAPDLIDEAIVGLGPEQLARLAVEELRRVRGLDKRLTIDSGAVSATLFARAIASSTGIRAAWRCSQASGYLMGMAADGTEVGSFAYDGDTVRRWADLAPALEIAHQRFVDGALGALGATAGRSFRGAVVLPPSTVAELLLGPLLGMLGADEVRQGRSPFAEKVGQQVAVPGITLTTGGPGLDVHPLAPFDREGVPRTRRNIVDNGVLTGFFYDAKEAAAAGVAPTGDAGGSAGSAPRVSSGVLDMAAGSTPRRELEQGEDAVVVTRWSGSTNPVSGEFSGVVKGGYLVEGGERRPIRETTIAGSVWDALQAVSRISAERETHSGTSRLPWVRVEDVSVTAG
jgi:PmbA protein